MFCPRCGIPSGDGEVICMRCGTTISSTAVLTQAQPPFHTSARPWIRYWARMFDITAYTIVVVLLIGTFAPRAFSEKDSDLIFWLFITFTWIFVESALLSLVGTTPGKALFKIRLSLDGGGPIPFIFAFYRSIRVWWRGFGAGFPLVTIFTFLHAKTVLSRDGITTWDRELGFRVSHEDIGAIRTITAVIWFGIWFGLTIAESLMEAPQ